MDPKWARAQGPNEWAQVGPGPGPNEWAQWEADPLDRLPSHPTIRSDFLQVIRLV